MATASCKIGFAKGGAAKEENLGDTSDLEEEYEDADGESEHLKDGSRKRRRRNSDPAVITGLVLPELIRELVIRTRSEQSFSARIAVLERGRGPRDGEAGRA